MFSIVSSHPMRSTAAARFICTATSSRSRFPHISSPLKRYFSSRHPTPTDQALLPTLQHAAHQESLRDPEGFWGNVAEQVGLQWERKWDKVLDSSQKPIFQWFPGATLNTCFNALDVHVGRGRGHRTALIYDSPMTKSIRRISYIELLQRVSVFAGALAARGVGKGDRVLIYMPMIPEAVIAMLACARLGAIHSVVFGGFASMELATRIKDAEPKVVVSASCGLEVNKVVPFKPLLDHAIELSPHKPSLCVVVQRPQLPASLQQGRDVDWTEFVRNAKEHACVTVESTDPLYVLYTSGTTGEPKGVVRDNGGHAVVMKWSMKNIFGIDEDDTWWAGSDVGWVVGHSYIVYAPLLAGCTSVLYEGKPVGTPDPGAIFRVISQHKVKSMFTAPTALRAIKREDPDGKYLKPYNLDSLKSLFVAGERLDPDTLQWAQSKLPGIPVVDHYWQTETGWPIIACAQGMGPAPPVRSGSSGLPLPGYDVRVVAHHKEAGEVREVGPEKEGDIVIRLPLPPGTLPTLFRSKERYVKSYLTKFPGYYDTSDSGYIDKDGYVYIMARTDDAINVAGHRLSTGLMEEVVSSHPDVAECAVVGIDDALKGQLPVGFVVLKSGSSSLRDHLDIKEEITSLIRSSIGPVASYRTTHVVRSLPKTRSGKVLRRTLRDIVHLRGLDGVKVPATIEDTSVLTEINLLVNPKPKRDQSVTSSDGLHRDN